MIRMATVAQWLFFLLMGTIVVGLIFVSILWRQQPPELTLQGRVENTKIKAGDDLMVHNRFTRPIDCASWWHRYIYDANGMQIQGFSEYRPAGAPQEYTRAIRIPDGTKPGRAIYQSTIFWECNLIQQSWPKEVDLPSIELQITK